MKSVTEMLNVSLFRRISTWFDAFHRVGVAVGITVFLQCTVSLSYKTELFRPIFLITRHCLTRLDRDILTQGRRNRHPYKAKTVQFKGRSPLRAKAATLCATSLAVLCTQLKEVSSNLAKKQMSSTTAIAS